MPYLVIRELGAERTLAIADSELSIGRSRQNQVKLLTDQASREHSRILKTPLGYKVVDVESSNGTYVNGQRITEKDLADGDSIGVGHATIIFREGDVPKPAPGLPDSVTSPIPLQDRNVRLLIETIVNAGAAQDLDSFLSSAVDNVVEIAQAERGVLFTRRPNGELKSLVARDGSKKPIEKLEGMSRTIPAQVDGSGEAIYLLDTESGKDQVQSDSVSMYQLRTVMCAPLRVGERRLGVMYVDSHVKTREYSSTDLAMFEAVTNYLALTMENLRATQDARKQTEERKQALEKQVVVLRSALEKRKHLIGECPAMKALYDKVRKVAPTDATALVLGESGTGKEAIAHVIHDLSPRSSKPFVVIDCAAIPETLLESELFGYEKGAFTGATSQKPGKLELGHGGTVFLDEIAELTPNLQVKLLRALEQRSVMRVGGVDPIPVDFRLVAATNHNLEEMVRQSTFRQDLYFRLKVVTIALPPLRERGEDILLLAEFFLKDVADSNSRGVQGFSEEAKGALRNHRWDGNVRELKHRIEQAVILTKNQYLSTDDLNLGPGGGSFQSLEFARDHFEKTYIVQALSRNNYNVTHTARALGISRQHLQNLIKKYGIIKFEDSGQYPSLS